ncbi:MAG: preprotein translocase subunit SecG [Alphaproteobacteria bacterium]|nr:preprotein translocase subunit SecG [Alphaproteobacteria bacterium]
MINILLIVHILIGLALIGLVLVQKSEGGVLGIGGGAKMGGLMTGAGAGNFLSRMTTYLAIAFFILSLSLSLMVAVQNKKAEKSIIDAHTQEQPAEKIPAVPTE